MGVVYTEDNYIMLSALQHYLFCPRQCALIHLEQIWEENQLTIKGELLHEYIHKDKKETRKDVIKSRGLRLFSKKYGITGQADLVEFYHAEKSDETTQIKGRKGWWRLFPVEYKRGKPKRDNCDKVQLCSQALCLEEMLQCTIKNGALYYGEKRHRIEVLFDSALREETEHIITEVHKLFLENRTPKPVYSPKCRSCSLLNYCNPKQFEHDKSRAYTEKIFECL